MAQSELKSGESTFTSSIENAVNYTRWVLSNYEKHFGRSILEVGLGHGAYRKFLPNSAQYTGLDIDEHCIQQARIQYPNDYFVQSDITDSNLGALVEERNIDTILCLNVLEHIQDDKQAINNMLKQLKKHGKLLLFVPAYQWLYSDMDKLAGHFRRYRLNDIHNLLPGDVELLESKYFNAVGGFGWWLNKFAKHNSLDSSAINAQVQFFDKNIVPIAKYVDIGTSKFFGQSLIWVIQKK